MKAGEYAAIRPHLAESDGVAAPNVGASMLFSAATLCLAGDDVGAADMMEVLDRKGQ